MLPACSAASLPPHPFGNLHFAAAPSASVRFHRRQSLPGEGSWPSALTFLVLKSANSGSSPWNVPLHASAPGAPAGTASGAAHGHRPAC
eukprot:361323-Chlamydomonas_euryale.AAC.7